MILAVFFCKGGLQWLYNLDCKQCMMNITSIYKKTRLEWKPKNYELILQNRFVVMVHPRKFFNAGLWWLSIRCKHVVFVRWETAGAENALIYIQDVPNEIKYSFLYSSLPQACSCCRVGPINIPRCPHNSDQGLGNCDW